MGGGAGSRGWVLGLLILALAGCAGPLRPTIQKSGDIWIKPETPVVVGAGARVVLLPPLSDPGQEKRAVVGVDLLKEELQTRRPTWSLVAPEALLDPNTPEGADPQVRTILDRLASSRAMATEDELRRLGAGTGASHLLQTRLLFLKTEGESEVSFLVSLHRATDGQKAWEGTGKAVGQHTIFGLFGPISIPIPFRTVAREAIQAVVDRLPE